MPLLSRAETQFLRRHLNQVCHVTLDPAGARRGCASTLCPTATACGEVPFVAILNGRDILPLRVSWAILLANFIEALHAHEGEPLTPEQRDAAARAAVEATAAVYRKTPKEQIAADLQSMMATLFAVAHGQTPPLGVQPMDLGAYAPHMTAPPPHRPACQRDGQGRGLALQPEMPALLRRAPALRRGGGAGHRPVAGRDPENAAPPGCRS